MATGDALQGGVLWCVAVHVLELWPEQNRTEQESDWSDSSRSQKLPKQKKKTTEPNFEALSRRV
jgi:hypothetical protein